MIRSSQDEGSREGPTRLRSCGTSRQTVLLGTSRLQAHHQISLFRRVQQQEHLRFCTNSDCHSTNRGLSAPQLHVPMALHIQVPHYVKNETSVHLYHFTSHTSQIVPPKTFYRKDFFFLFFIWVNPELKYFDFSESSDV